MDDQILNDITKSIDPIAMEKYFRGVTFPVNEEDLMQIVRSNNAPDEIIAQMDEMLRSERFTSLTQLENELAGFYNDGELESADSEDTDNSIDE